jgi:MYXO-CTERM domain-containing protein
MATAVRVLAVTLMLPAALGLALASPAVTASPTEPGTLQQPLAPAEGCSSCHDFFTPIDLAENGGSVDPWAWQGSMMGNSARDPVFWAGVALAAQDHPGETVDCVRCHAPQAFLAGHGSVTTLAELSVDEREGLACDACHRMIDDGETPAGNARYVIADAPVGEPVPRFGPWSYTPPGPSPPHGWGQDLEFLPSSRMCGTCHDVTTPRERLDERGVGLGVPFNEQRTYSEWLGSAYADPSAPEHASCQDCHMPAIEGPILGCNMFAGMPHESGGRRHVLVGANATTLRVLQSLYGDAGTGEVADARFAESIAWTEEFVQTAATLDVEFPDSVHASAGIPQLGVTVTNRTGHKLPSGYSEGRVMWLELTARYQGELVWSSGLWDADAKTIEADAQVRRYEALAERYADGKHFHLLLNDHWVVDSRIPPKGLAPDLETDPVGDRYAVQADGTWPHFDVHSYAFAGVELVDQTPGDEDLLELEVRLLYLINTPEYLQVLADDNLSNDAGAEVVAAFAAVGGPEPIVLARQSVSVPLTGLIDGGDGDPGDGDPDDGDPGDGDGDPSGESETGAGPAIDEGRGCSCATDPSEGSPGWLLFMFLLPVVARRP